MMLSPSFCLVKTPGIVLAARILRRAQQPQTPQEQLNHLRSSTTAKLSSNNQELIQPPAMTVTDYSAEKVLLIGSPRSMKDGSYAELITRFDHQTPSKTVDKELCDRISDGATTLLQSGYNVVYLIVDLEDLSSSAHSSPSEFLRKVLPSLKPPGKFTWKTQSDPATIESALKASSSMVDVQVIGQSDGSQLITAIKSSHPNSVAINLPKKAQKASLWSFSSSTTGEEEEAELIDDSKLLTAEDLEKPSIQANDDACNPKKAKKACKNCTCGLRELQLSGEDDLPKNLKVDAGTQSIDSDKLTVNPNPVKFTSSCGSCYLGDAFRCSSCPYLGMPAFEPGQEVKLTSEMGDDIQT